MVMIREPREIYQAAGRVEYVVEGGPIAVNGYDLPALAAAQITGVPEIAVRCESPAELLLVDVAL